MPFNKRKPWLPLQHRAPGTGHVWFWSLLWNATIACAVACNSVLEAEALIYMNSMLMEDYLQFVTESALKLRGFLARFGPTWCQSKGFWRAPVLFIMLQRGLQTSFDMFGVTQRYKLLFYQMQLTEKWKNTPSSLPLQKHLKRSVSGNLAGRRELAEYIVLYEIQRGRCSADGFNRYTSDMRMTALLDFRRWCVTWAVRYSTSS